MFLALLLGFIASFIGHIPVAGPIAALVLARSIQGRPRAAIAIAAGGAISESTYAILAALGMSVLLERYPSVLPFSQVLGALIFAAIGLLLLIRPPVAKTVDSDAAPPSDSGGRSLLLGLTISALNPTFLLTWTAFSATLVAGGWLVLTPQTAPFFGLGILTGMIAWFALLVLIVRRYQDRFSPKRLGIVLRVIGLALCGLAGWMGWKAWAG